MENIRYISRPQTKEKAVFAKIMAFAYLSIPSVLGFFLSKTVLFNAISPFGIGFFMSLLSIKDNKKMAMFCVGVGSLIGILSVGDLTFALKYLLSYLLCGLLYITYSIIFSKKPKSLILGGIVSVSMAISGTIFISQFGFYVYDILMLFFEIILAFATTIIFEKTAYVLCDKGQNQYYTEDIISVFIAVAIALVGMSKVNFFNINLMETVGILTILLTALVGGASFSTIAGVAIGLLCGLNGFYTIETLGTYAFYGLLAGVLARFSKGGSILGIVLANAVLSVFFGSADGAMPNFPTLIFGVILFLAVPNKLIKKLKNSIHMPNTTDATHLIREKLGDLARIFENLGMTYKSIGSEENSQNLGHEVMNKTTKIVCKHCESRHTCWGKIKNDTIFELNEVINLADANGSIVLENFPDEFQDKCVHFQGFYRTFAELLSKKDVSSKNDLLHVKNLAYEQMNGVSKIIGNLALEVSEELAVQVDKPKYRIICGFATKTKAGGEISGDNCSYLPIDDNRFLMVLCDGMGSGNLAHSQSQDTVKLLKELLRGGFDKSNSIGIINALLILKEKNETFTTMDIFIFDNIKGKGEFIKIGANHSYCIAKSAVKKIKSSSLPMGILDNIDMESSEVCLSCGDTVVMLSDGVEDVTHSWLGEFLRVHKEENPQKLCNMIMAEGVKNMKNRDDMTVLVGKVGNLGTSSI